MADVVDLASRRVASSADGYLTGECLCVACQHEWQGTAPVGVFDGLECPKCKTTKGVLRHGVVPEVYWECGCGCHLFAVSGISKQVLCWQCGVAQNFGE